VHSSCIEQELRCLKDKKSPIILLPAGDWQCFVHATPNNYGYKTRAKGGGGTQADIMKVGDLLSLRSFTDEWKQKHEYAFHLHEIYDTLRHEQDMSNRSYMIL
jgi:hypothetical protein